MKCQPEETTLVESIRPKDAERDQSGPHSRNIVFAPVARLTFHAMPIWSTTYKCSRSPGAATPLFGAVSPVTTGSNEISGPNLRIGAN